MDEFRLQSEAAAGLAALARSPKTAADYLAAASLCRKQARAYSDEMLRCHDELELLVLRRANDRQSMSRRQALTERIRRYNEMAAKWNELAEVYEREAGDPDGTPAAA
jgi:hypothetical protein